MCQGQSQKLGVEVSMVEAGDITLKERLIKANVVEESSGWKLKNQKKKRNLTWIQPLLNNIKFKKIEKF